MKIMFKGQEVTPYESFYHNQSVRFFKGTIGGQSRCVTTLDNLAIVEVVYEEDCNPRRIQQ